MPHTTESINQHRSNPPSMANGTKRRICARCEQPCEIRIKRTKRNLLPEFNAADEEERTIVLDDDSLEDALGEESDSEASGFSSPDDSDDSDDSEDSYGYRTRLGRLTVYVQEDGSKAVVLGGRDGESWTAEQAHPKDVLRLIQNNLRREYEANQGYLCEGPRTMTVKSVTLLANGASSFSMADESVDLENLGLDQLYTLAEWQSLVEFVTEDVWPRAIETAFADLHVFGDEVSPVGGG